MSGSPVPMDSEASPSVGDLLALAATASSAWILLEQHGRVVAHAVGPQPCPHPLQSAILHKSTVDLNAATTWRRGTRPLQGDLEDCVVTNVPIGPGCAVWVVGGHPEMMDMLANGLARSEPAIHDPLVAELLHPVGPRRRELAPAGLVAVLQGASSNRLSHAAAACVDGLGRVHTDGDRVLVVLPEDADVHGLLRQVRQVHPDVVGGVSVAPAHAHDWGGAVEVAIAAMRRGVALSDVRQPEVALAVLLRLASQTARQTVVPDPLASLEAHPDLRQTLQAWCRSGFDVAACAGSMSLHVNTVRYRIRRIAELTRLELCDVRTRVALYLLANDDS